MRKLTLTMLMLLIAICIFPLQSAISSEKGGLLEANWDSILQKSNGQTINMYMWGGNNGTNLYIDEWIAPRMKKEYGITIRRIPVTDIRQIINKLLTEKAMKKLEGSADIIWINGENFKLARENDLLFGPFTGKLPNYLKYVDMAAEDLNFDFNYPTDGYEAPWGKAQFIFVYDSNNIQIPPKSIGELGRWIREHPGRFTYPAPPDFTGSSFVRHVLLEEYGGYKRYQEKKQQGILDNSNEKAWNFLNDIKPYLWRKGTTYPDGIGVLDQLYANGEVWITMNYNPLHALNQINNGLFPDSSRTFVLEGGTFSNTHYLAIPFNSTKREGAMVAIDLFLSPEAQIEKFKPGVWGDGMVVDTSRITIKQKELLETIDLGQSVIAPQILQNYGVPEFSSDYIDSLEKEWLENVGKK